MKEIFSLVGDALNRGQKQQQKNYIQQCDNNRLLSSFTYV